MRELIEEEIRLYLRKIILMGLNSCDTLEMFEAFILQHGVKIHKYTHSHNERLYGLAYIYRGTTTKSSLLGEFYALDSLKSRLRFS